MTEHWIEDKVGIEVVELEAVKIPEIELEPDATTAAAEVVELSPPPTLSLEIYFLFFGDLLYLDFLKDLLFA